jgi:hypothetical protein
MTPQRPPGLATFQEAHATGWPLLLAGSVMSLVPMLIISWRPSGTWSVRWPPSDWPGREPGT